MKKNLYYASVLRRQNVLLETILGFFAFCASYPRLVLEVFIRKNFGERYFKLASAITVAAILIAYPFVKRWFVGAVDIADLDEDSGVYGVATKAPSYFKPYYSWFIFIALFLGVSVIRWLEQKRNPSVFDFARYSLSRGKINPLFSNLKIGGKKVSIRLIETVLEPAIFLLIGLALYYLLGQKVGLLLIVFSIFYSLGYVAAYNIGDNFIMDRIDEMIVNQELKNAFVDDMDESQTRGFRFLGTKPEDIETRRKLLSTMLTEGEENATVE